VNVFLVRHADAGDREPWTAPDAERPLSDKGWRQARGLARVLADASFERIMSSPYLRCVQTVEPLAKARGIDIELDDRLAEGSPWREALKLITDAEVAAVMCSQGDVIAAIVDDLARQGLIAVREARWQKGSTWKLKVRKGEIVKATYLPPTLAD
jgi:8-oxo-dGTP diphosphatase